MANVTYLLGAGASANCLPTYINFFKRFVRFRNYFTETSPKIKGLPDSLKQDAYEIKRFLDQIVDEFRYHNTPDTIAKKYFHSSNKEYELSLLKNMLILFFIYNQILEETTPDKEIGDPDFKQPIDKRYDAFISALLVPVKNKLELRNQFKILTWNYDLQFEITYARYRETSVPNSQRIIQSFPLIFPQGNEQFDCNKFGIIHLNGIAYAKPSSNFDNKDYLGRFHRDDLNVMTYLTEVHHSMNSKDLIKEVGGSNLLSFAWEKQYKNDNIRDDELLQKAIHIANQTDILVIIGYSFPIFNNAIDKILLGEMGKLKRVYIQSPNAKEIENILTDFSIPPGKIKDVGYFSQFHIPIEWDRIY